MGGGQCPAPAPVGVRGEGWDTTCSMALDPSTHLEWTSKTTTTTGMLPCATRTVMETERPTAKNWGTLSVSGHLQAASPPAQPLGTRVCVRVIGVAATRLRLLPCVNVCQTRNAAISWLLVIILYTYMPSYLIVVFFAA